MKREREDNGSGTLPNGHEVADSNAPSIAAWAAPSLEGDSPKTEDGKVNLTEPSQAIGVAANRPKKPKLTNVPISEPGVADHESTGKDESTTAVEVPHSAAVNVMPASDVKTEPTESALEEKSPEMTASEAILNDPAISLLEPGDEDVLRPYVVEFFQHFMPWIAREEDLARCRSMHYNQRFIMCRYCCDYRSFNNVENTGKSFHHGVKHFEGSCKFVPPDVQAFAKTRKPGDSPGKPFCELIFQRINQMDETTIMRAMEAALASRGELPARVPKKLREPRKVEKIVQIQVLRALPDSEKEKYVEETAFLYHNPPSAKDELHCEEAVEDEDLKAIPPPAPFPSAEYLRKNSDAVWTRFPEKRVIIADFKNVKGRISGEDLQKLGELMERDDVTVISEGIFTPNEKEWLDFGKLASGHGWSIMHHHKFKRFTYDKEAKAYREGKSMLSMKLTTFFSYLEKRKRNEPSIITASTVLGEEVQIDCQKDVVYCLDLDITRLLAGLNRTLQENFKIPQVLPGAEWCSLRWVPQSARNFMGPNLYVCPPGGFTQFHQDGRGTVDSGHYVVDGYNEVIMLRRLPPRHKQKIMNTDLGVCAKEFDKSFALPHSDQTKSEWPSDDLIKTWAKQNYCPSVFILKPGQMVHINKGRLHAFRKMGRPEDIPDSDCHKQLRTEIVNDLKQKKGDGTYDLPVTVSIAWDWQFLGRSGQGIYRETASMLESQYVVDSQPDNLTSLATSKAAILAMASHIFPSDPSKMEVARGIWPVLKYIIEQEQECYAEAAAKAQGVYEPPPLPPPEPKPAPSAETNAEPGLEATAEPSAETKLNTEPNVEPKADSSAEPNVETKPGLELKSDTSAEPNEEPKPNAETNVEPPRRIQPVQDGIIINKYSDQAIGPLRTPVDPFGEDYTCIYCKGELPNYYYHCYGCEALLQKDFNVCRKCYNEKKWRTREVTTVNEEYYSDVNHVGTRIGQPRKCPAGCLLTCPNCNKCLSCGCICHSFMTLHGRYFDKDDFVLLKEKFESAALEPVVYQEYTRARLDSARDRSGAGRKAKGDALKNFRTDLHDIEYPKEIKIMVDEELPLPPKQNPPEETAPPLPEKESPALLEEEKPSLPEKTAVQQETKPVPQDESKKKRGRRSPLVRPVTESLPKKSKGKKRRGPLKKRDPPTTTLSSADAESLVADPLPMEASKEKKKLGRPPKKRDPPPRPESSEDTEAMFTDPGATPNIDAEDSLDEETQSPTPVSTPDIQDPGEVLI